MTPGLLWALLLATAIPTAVPVILVAGFDFQAQPAWIMSRMGLLGVLHTGATGFFYTERRDPARMVWLPLGFIALAAAVFALGPQHFRQCQTLASASSPAIVPQAGGQFDDRCQRDRHSPVAIQRSFARRAH